MPHRKSQVTVARLKRDWPHHVALPAAALRGVRQSEAVYAFVKPLSVGPRPYHLTRGDDDFVVFCFAMPDDAAAFCDRFGGERLDQP